MSEGRKLVFKLILLSCVILAIYIYESHSHPEENFLNGSPNNGGANNPVLDKDQILTFVTNFVLNWSIMGKKFERWTTKNGNLSYEEWTDLRIQDGALCRDDKDCNWIEESLVCQDVCFKPVPNVSSIKH